MKTKQLASLLLLISTVSTFAQVPFVKSREHIDLTHWAFTKGVIYNAQAIDFDDSAWEKVKAPHTYSMEAIEEVGYYRGMAWYRTNITIPESMKDGRVYIYFEGVGQEATVYVNQKQVGFHIGGYSAFCYEITDVAKIGASNQITVKVSNAPNFKRIPTTDVLFNHYGGIYRPAQIFSTPKCNISPAYHASSGVFVELKEINDDVAKVEVRSHISNKNEITSAELNYKFIDADKAVVLESSKEISGLEGEQVITETFEIKNPVRWNGRKNPYLYDVEVSLTCGENKDKVNQTFGLRTFSVDPAKGMLLNDEPYRVYGVAMHQEWKQVGPVLTPYHHKKDMELVNEIGATGLRLSHYQHSDITYQLADEIGLMVWTEIPFVYDYSGREFENAKSQLTELIIQNYNHPSIYLWGIWNEVRAWEHPGEACVTLTKELNDLAHQLDGTRLTTSASDREMTAPMTNLTDLQAWNKYFGWYYGEYADMATWLDEAHRDYPDIELGISEYGIGGNIYQQDVTKLEKPVGNYFPEPEQTLYHELTWKIIKDRSFVWGSFIWNMFDFSVAGWNRGGIKNLNHKGLITFDREVKKDAFYFYKANWSDEPVLYIAERRNDKRNEETVSVKVYTNQPKLTLYINGNKISTKKLESDIQILQFDGIQLNKGKNIIKVVSAMGNYSDEVVWELE